MSGGDKPEPGEDFGIASSLAASLADTVPPLTRENLAIAAASLPDATTPPRIVRLALTAEDLAIAWRAVAVNAATRAHDMHTAKGEYSTYFTWHDCQHTACRAFRADALTPLEIKS